MKFNKFKGELASVVTNKLDIDVSNSRLYQKPYNSDFDIMGSPLLACTGFY
jgi:hypothetical protein